MNLDNKYYKIMKYEKWFQKTEVPTTVEEFEQLQFDSFSDSELIWLLDNLTFYSADLWLHGILLNSNPCTYCLKSSKTRFNMDLIRNRIKNSLTYHFTSKITRDDREPSELEGNYGFGLTKKEDEWFYVSIRSLESKSVSDHNRIFCHYPEELRMQPRAVVRNGALIDQCDFGGYFECDGYFGVKRLLTDFGFVNQKSQLINAS